MEYSTKTACVPEIIIKLLILSITTQFSSLHENKQGTLSILTHNLNEVCEDDAIS